MVGLRFGDSQLVNGVKGLLTCGDRNPCPGVELAQAMILLEGIPWSVSGVGQDLAGYLRDSVIAEMVFVCSPLGVKVGC